MAHDACTLQPLRTTWEAALAHLVAIVEDGHGVALLQELLGKVQANECVSAPLCIDYEHLLSAHSHCEALGWPAC